MAYEQKKYTESDNVKKFRENMESQGPKRYQVPWNGWIISPYYGRWIPPIGKDPKQKPLPKRLWIIPSRG